MADAALSFLVDSQTRPVRIVRGRAWGQEAWPRQAMLRLTAEGPGVYLQPTAASGCASSTSHINTRMEGPHTLLAQVPLELSVWLCGPMCPLLLELRLDDPRTVMDVIGLNSPQMPPAVRVQAELFLR